MEKSWGGRRHGWPAPAPARLACAGAARALRTEERVHMRARLCARACDGCAAPAGCRQERRAYSGRRGADVSPAPRVGEKWQNVGVKKFNGKPAA